MSIKISPSILAADFGNLSEECNKIHNSNADWFHLDVMDGLFVPNISFGMPIIKSIRNMTDKPLDVHLMIVEPERYIDNFINLGSDILTVHIEATNRLDEIINRVHGFSVKSGVAINPETPIEKLEKYIDKIDLVCLMGVNPGFAGQKFIEKTYDRLEKIRKLVDSRNSKTLIEVDGGVNKENIDKLRSIGGDVFVAGSYIFNSSDYNAAINSLK